jgi:hypothetical protein
MAAWRLRLETGRIEAQGVPQQAHRAGVCRYTAALKNATKGDSTR